MGPNAQKRPTGRQLDHLFRVLRQQVGEQLKTDPNPVPLEAVQVLLAGADRQLGASRLVYEAIRIAALDNPLKAEVLRDSAGMCNAYPSGYHLVANKQVVRERLSLPKINLNGGTGQAYGSIAESEIRIALPSQKYLTRTWPSASPEKTIPTIIEGLVTVLHGCQPVEMRGNYEVLLEKGQWRTDHEVTSQLKLIDDNLTGDVLTTWVSLGRWCQGTARACRLDILVKGQLPLTTALGLVSALMVPERFDGDKSMILACTGDEVAFDGKRYCTGIAYRDKRIVLVPLDVTVPYQDVGAGRAWLPTHWRIPD